MTYFYDYTPPIRVKGGIKSQSGRRKSQQSWWTERWMETLDTSEAGEGRVSRARSYARNGQVRSLDIRGGAASASVQGSRRRPYDVEIRVGAIDGPGWNRLARVIRERPDITAGLLAGKMPEDIEKAFTKADLSLFPKESEIDTECTCPDWSNPCKHTMAVFFLLAEEFERDPFLIFRLRGSGREEMLKMAGIRQRAGAKAGAETEARPKTGRKERQKSDAHGRLAAEPLPTNPDVFWGRSLEACDPGDAFVPKVHAVLPKQLGRFPLWRGGEDFISTMINVYRDASRTGMRAFLADTDDGQ